MNAGGQSATVVSYGYVQYNSCLFATYNLSAPGLAPLLNAVYYGAASYAYFNIAVPQVVVTAAQGGSVTLPVSFTSALGYAGPVQLGVVTPSGIAASWDVSALALDGVNGASANLTLAVDPGLARGTYAVFIPGGTYAGNAGYFFVTVTPNTVPDFVLSSITPVSVTAGQAVAFSARVVPVAGFGGAVTVSSPGVPGAVGLTFAPNTTGALTGSGQVVTGTVATFATTPNCAYTVPVTAVSSGGASGGITHSGTVSVAVRGGVTPGFAVSAPDVTVTQGTSGTVPVTVNLSACFSGVPQYSAASVGGIPMGLPGGASVAVNGAGSMVAGFSFFAPLSMVPGTYAGTATVTIGLISHAVAFSVKVVPNTTPYYTFTPFNSAPLVPGGSVTRYFVVLKQNGYNGVPVFSVNPAFLPAGISVVFSDGGKATYGTATATISAANTVVPNNGFSIPVDSSDGALSVSFPVGVQIVAAPLGVTYSVAYSNISSATKRGTVAVLTPRITGGTPPFTVTGTGLGAQSGTTFTTNGQADVTGTLTVTDTSGAVATVAATIPAAPVVSDAILASMAMERILAFESQAAQLVARGKDDSALRAAFLAAAKISAMDYAGLRNMAVSYKSSQSGAVQAAQTALGAVLLAGAVPGMASPTVAQARALQTLQTDYNQGVGLAAALGPAFSGLAGAAAMVSTVIGPGGGGGNGPILHVPANCPPDWTQCPQLVSDSEVSVDPVSGWVSGSAWSYLVFNGSLTSYAKLQAKVDAGLDGPGGHLDGNSAEDDNGGTARVALGAQATADGLYTVSGFGTGMAEDAALNFYHFDGNATFRNSDKWKAPACSGPVVTAITVDGAGTNAFVAGASGTAVVSGTCLAGVTGVSLSGALQGQQGQRLTLTLGPVGFDQVNLTYRVDAGATASSGSVLLSAGSGTVSIPAMVVPSLPYISAITPSPWQAGTSVAFTISGAGFGLSPTVTISSDQLGGLAATYCTVLYPCSDGLIQGTVDLPVEFVDDQATISLTFNGYQNGFAAAQEPPGKARVTKAPIKPAVPALNCPDSVIRGTSITCTLTGVPAQSVSSWSFSNQKVANSPVAAVTIQGPAGKSNWTGIMVITGDINVSIKGFSSALAARVSVTARSWGISPALPIEVPNGQLVGDTGPIILPVPPQPSPALDPNGNAIPGQFLSGLGYSAASFSWAAPTYNQIGTGPNAGFIYVLSPVAISPVYNYEINPDLVNATSEFSQHQCGAGGYIAWSDLLAQVRRHEYNSPTQSHWNSYQASFALPANNPGVHFEALVGAPGATVDDLGFKANKDLSTASETIAAAMRLEPYLVNYSETGVRLGSVNYGPNYASCQ